jgi:hypothetical protein
MSDRQKLFYALLASAFFHFALALLLALWTAQHSSEVVKALPDLSQLTVTIMPAKHEPTPPAAIPAPKPPPAVAAVPTPKPAVQVKIPELDSDGFKTSSKAPAHAFFQSDSNLVAGSQLPASGDLPLPSMAGPQRNFIDFAGRAASLGKGQAPAAPLPVRPAAPAAPAMPEQTPSAITQVQHTPAPEHPVQSTPVPTPVSAPIAQSTPVPTPKPTVKTTPAPDTIALGKATPTPPPATRLPTPIEQLARLTTPPSLRGSAEMAPMPATALPKPAVRQSQPPAPRSAEPRTQRETEKTRVNGGITTLGAPGVDAVETPYGRYHRKLANLIGSRWNLYYQEHPKEVGDVTIHFRLNANGTVAGTPRVAANHSIDDLAELSIRAIMDSTLPPVPDDLAPMLKDGKLEVDFNFTVYDPSNDSPGR